MAERWVTPHDIARARDRFEAALDWERPAAFGVGFPQPRYHDGEDETREERPADLGFTRIDVGGGYLSAAILATVVGHRGGSASYRLGRAALERAVGLLEPAEACPGIGHPNLRAWRAMLECLWSTDAVAVFAASLDDAEHDDPFVSRLVELATRDRHRVPGTALDWWNPAPTAEATARILAWEENWPGGHPVADELKYRFPDRWVRFHSLPESKRYPDTPAEYDELLHRHNTVLAELCGRRGAAGPPSLCVVSIEVCPRPLPAPGARESRRAAGRGILGERPLARPRSRSVLRAPVPAGGDVGPRRAGRPAALRCGRGGVGRTDRSTGFRLALPPLRRGRGRSCAHRGRARRTE